MEPRGGKMYPTGGNRQKGRREEANIGPDEREQEQEQAMSD